MNLNEIFKAIKLRIKTSKPYIKDLYGEHCREFIFEDCYGNDVGVFIVHPEGDVCQIIVDAVVKEDVCAESLPNTITYRWINPLTTHSREIILSRKSSQEQLREIYVHRNICFENIKSETQILEILSYVVDGKEYILNNINNHLNDNNLDLINSELNKEVFLTLAKAAYSKNISIIDLIKDLLSSNSNVSCKNSEMSISSIASSESEVNLSFIPRGVSNSALLFKEKELSNEGEDTICKSLIDNGYFGLTSSSVKKITEGNSSLLSGSEIKQINSDNLLLSGSKIEHNILPNYLRGTFQIGKGFVSVNAKAINEKENIFKENHLDVEDSADISRRYLKEKALPVSGVVNLKDGIKNHIHRYPGEKTVLSNMTTIFKV